MTAEPGRPVVVLTADCGPLVLACDDALAVVHVGWLGLCAGVVEAAAARLRAVGRGTLTAALGPCIHPAHYAFGADDLDGTVQEERIYHMAGSKTPEAMTTKAIRRLIRAAGREPVERDTLYNVITGPEADLHAASA